jgi:hypothetical protein
MKIIINCDINGVKANIFSYLLKIESIYSKRVLGFNQMIRYIYFMELHLQVQYYIQSREFQYHPFQTLISIDFIVEVTEVIVISRQHIEI